MPTSSSKPKADPSKKYVYVTVKNKKTGETERRAMEKSRAQKLRSDRKRKKELASTTSQIPKQYRDLVDPGAINDAVAAHIAGLNAPLDQARSEAEKQAATNQRMAESLGAQTQATLDQLLRNTDARTSGFQQLAGRSVAAAQETNQAAGSAIARALGGALNPQTAAMIDANLQPAQAQQHASGVGDVWANTLASGAQRDFFERGKGISAISQQAFNEGQRRDLQTVLARIASQQTANNQQRAALVRDMAEKEAQFAFERETAAAAFGAEQQQQAFENNLDTYEAETGRIGALSKGSKGGGGGSGGSAADRKRWNSVRDDVYENVRKMQATVGQIKNKDTGETWTKAGVWGKGNGPWREAFTQLEAKGVPRSAAALMATKMFPSSIQTSTPTNILAMLRRRGVPDKTIAGILNQNFGKGTYQKLASPAKVESGGTYRPTNSTTSGEWAKKLKGKVIKMRGKQYRFMGLYGDKWGFRDENGVLRQVPVRPGWSPVVSLRESF